MDKYMKNAEDLVESGVDSLCIKDMAGLLTPYKAYELVKNLKDNFDIPVDVHSHNTAGFAFMTYIKAAEAGADIIDTSISALSSGSSQPTTETIVAAFEDTEYDTGLNFDDLEHIGKYFREIRDKYSEFLGSFEVDPRIISNQLPGGMVSNLRSQLKTKGIFDRYDEILEEIPKVRKDLGYPPLVTPTSQIIGTQAVFNVIAQGGRYSVVPTEVKEYLRGKYGRPPADVNEELRERLINADEIIDDRPANHLAPIFNISADKISNLTDLEEDVLSYIIFPDVTEKFLENRQEKLEKKYAAS